MHAKYALALILALQVSVSLCDDTVPSDELLQKYNEMKTKFSRRMLNLADQIQAHIQPYLQTENGQAVMQYTAAVTGSPQFTTLQKLYNALCQEFIPVVEEIRMRALARYEQELRPQIGEQLSSFIVRMQAFLDRFMPAE